MEGAVSARGRAVLWRFRDLTQRLFLCGGVLDELRRFFRSFHAPARTCINAIACSAWLSRRHGQRRRQRRARAFHVASPGLRLRDVFERAQFPWPLRTLQLSAVFNAAASVAFAPSLSPFASCAFATATCIAAMSRMISFPPRTGAFHRLVYFQRRIEARLHTLEIPFLELPFRDLDPCHRHVILCFFCTAEMNGPPPPSPPPGSCAPPPYSLPALASRPAARKQTSGFPARPLVPRSFIRSIIFFAASKSP